MPAGGRSFFEPTVKIFFIGDIFLMVASKSVGFIVLREHRMTCVARKPCDDEIYESRSESYS